MLRLKTMLTSCILCLYCFTLSCDPTQDLFVEVDPDDPNDPWQQTFVMEKKLFEGKSPFQDILIFEHEEFGKMLVLNGLVQTTENDEYVYHEMLNHVPLLAHKNPKKVLVIGGGDGGSLREILRHNTVQKIVMVDIDGMVVDVCRKYIPSISNGAFENPRVELHIQDGIEYVRNCRETFDVIICDTTDPVGPGKVLFTKEFYANCKKLLNKDGILTTQNGMPLYMQDVLTDGQKALSESFKNVRFYIACVPTYLGGFMAFGFATDDDTALQRSLKELQDRRNTLSGPMRYYNSELHQAAFVLPEFIREQLPTK
jgi:spermidine synthase